MLVNEIKKSRSKIKAFLKLQQQLKEAVDGIKALDLEAGGIIKEALSIESWMGFWIHSRKIETATDFKERVLPYRKEIASDPSIPREQRKLFNKISAVISKHKLEFSKAFVFKKKKTIYLPGEGLLPIAHRVSKIMVFNHSTAIVFSNTETDSEVTQVYSLGKNQAFQPFDSLVLRLYGIGDWFIVEQLFDEICEVLSNAVAGFQTIREDFRECCDKIKACCMPTLLAKKI